MVQDGEYGNWLRVSCKRQDNKPASHRGEALGFFIIIVFVLKFCIIYNIILVSGVQHSDSVFLWIIFYLKLLQDNNG